MKQYTDKERLDWLDTKDVCERDWFRRLDGVPYRYWFGEHPKYKNENWYFGPIRNAIDEAMRRGER